MSTRLRKHVSYANVTATLALFIALGGTSYAATQLASNSVGSAQIRKSAVGPSELRSKSVSSRTIRDRTIQTRDLSVSTTEALRGTQGTQGPSGPKGDSPATLKAHVSADHQVRGGTVTAIRSPAAHIADVDFAAQISATHQFIDASCVAVASLSGSSSTTNPSGQITADIDGPFIVRVATYDAAGNPAALPFSVIVTC